MSDNAELHPAVAPWAFLIGTWQGSGRGHYPTIDAFEYREALTFAAIPGKPFLRYEQMTQSPVGAPMHTECGFFRPVDGGRVEFVVAQPTGQTELLEGVARESSDGELVVELTESQVANSGTAKQVDATQRRYAFDAARGRVEVEFGMAAVGQAMQQHLVSALEKAAG